MTKNSISKRNTTVELLRIFFMYCIVMSHGIGHGSDLNYELIYSWGGSFPDAIHLAMFSLGKIGVTGFMFISGYYGINLKKRILFTLFGICAFYYLILSQGRGILQLAFPFSDWWFVESYLIVCLLAPTIEIAFKTLDRKCMSLILLGFFYYSYIGKFIAIDNSHDAIMLLTIYLIARYLRTNEYNCTRILQNKMIIISGIMLIMLVPVIMCLLGFSFNFFRLWFQNNNILYLILSASLVMTLDNVKSYNITINWLSSSVLSVYLLTDNIFVRVPFDHWLFNEILEFRGYMYVLCVCIACMLFDKIRILFFDAIENFYIKVMR